MNDDRYIQGNLALAMPAADGLDETRSVRELPKPTLTVIEGGLRAKETRRRVPAVVLSAIAAVAIAVCAAALIWSAASGASARDRAIASMGFEQAVVQPGDTLWSIARDHAVDGVGTDEMVGIIKAENDLGASPIQPGQRLKVARAGD